jgi:HlyD family secretion protein
MTMTRRRRRALIWSVGTVVLVLGVIAAFVLSSRSGPTKVAVSTTTVSRGTVTLAVAASGTVTAAQTRGLSFSVAGTVTEVDVKPGDTVASGAVLAKIDPTEAQATVNDDLQRVSDATTAVDRAQQTANLPLCPSTTTPPPHPSTTSPSPHPSGSESPHPSASPSASPHPTSSSGGGGGGSGGGPGATPTCTRAGTGSVNDQLLSAEQQLNNANLALLQARDKLAGTTITAPLAGRVLSVGGKVGQSESPGGTGFVVLGDVSTLTVTAQFSEADVGKIVVGQIASIVLPNTTDAVSGKVSQVDPAATVSGRLVRYGVEVAFDQVPTDLLLGESATVTVTTASAQNVLYTSSAAVTGVANGKGRVTVQVAGHNVVRTVEVGLRGDQYTELKSGVSLGDVLVLPESGSV